MAYTQRRDIPEDRLRKEPVEKFVPNSFNGTLTVEFTNGVPKRVFQEKDSD